MEDKMGWAYDTHRKRYMNMKFWSEGPKRTGHLGDLDGWKYYDDLKETVCGFVWLRIGVQ
jgi:hypothetical protein